MSAKINELWTPGQVKVWEKMQDDPMVKRLIERLGLDPVKSREVVRGEAIQARVNGWIEQIALSPKTPMVVEVERLAPERQSPFENPDLSYLKPGECPF